MTASSLASYIHYILALIPWWHWVLMGAVAVGVFLLARRSRPAFGAVALGMTVFVGLFLLETAIVLRCCGLLPYIPGHDFRLGLKDLFQGSRVRRAELISNIAVFVPFGFFLAVWLASAKKRRGFWRRLGLATLGGFALSLCIECLQLVLRVGFFEVTDLVLNTFGAFVGALLEGVIDSRSGRE